MYSGQTKLILRHLGFLKKYGFEFCFQTFDDYKGFRGPIDTYSFYNKYGCFTLHNIAQKGEWNWFVSRSFSTNQYELLEKEIDPSFYISTKCWLYSTVIKRLAKFLEGQVIHGKSMFGIKIDQSSSNIFKSRNL